MSILKLRVLDHLQSVVEIKQQQFSDECELWAV